MNRKDVAAYTRWINATQTERELAKADEYLRTLEIAQQDGTLTEAARAHWIRKGADLILLFLRSQVTIDEFDNKNAADQTPDFGADAILDDELMRGED